MLLGFHCFCPFHWFFSISGLWLKFFLLFPILCIRTNYSFISFEKTHHLILKHTYIYKEVAHSCIPREFQLPRMLTSHMLPWYMIGTNKWTLLSHLQIFLECQQFSYKSLFFFFRPTIQSRMPHHSLVFLCFL